MRLYAASLRRRCCASGAGAVRRHRGAAQCAVDAAPLRRGAAGGTAPAAGGEELNEELLHAGGWNHRRWRDHVRGLPCAGTAGDEALMHKRECGPLEARTPWNPVVRLVVRLIRRWNDADRLPLNPAVIRP